MSPWTLTHAAGQTACESTPLLYFLTHTHTHTQTLQSLQLSLPYIPQLAPNNRQHFLRVRNNREQLPPAVTGEQECTIPLIVHFITCKLKTGPLMNRRLTWILGPITGEALHFQKYERLFLYKPFNHSELSGNTGDLIKMIAGGGFMLKLNLKGACVN